MLPSRDAAPEMLKQALARDAAALIRGESGMRSPHEP